MCTGVESELQPQQILTTANGAALTWAAQHDVDAAALRDDVVGHPFDRLACPLVGEIAATNCAVLHDLTHPSDR